MPRSPFRWTKPQTVVAIGIVALLGAGSVVAYTTQAHRSMVTGADKFSTVAPEGAGVVGAAVAPRPLPPVPSGVVSGGAPADSGAALGVASPPAPPVSVHDQVVHSASMNLSVAKRGFRAAFDRANAVAGELGGFVANSGSESVGGREATGHVSLRVPGDRFDEARRRLAAIGKVEQESVSGEDVTAQVVDLDARLRSLRAQEDALRTLLSRAKTVGEVIQVQEQLGVTRQQIEELAAQQAMLADRVAMASIDVTIGEAGAPAPGPRPKSILARSVERAAGAFLAVIGGTLVVLAALVPLSLLGLVGWALYRLTNRRRRPEAAA